MFYLMHIFIIMKILFISVAKRDNIDMSDRISLKYLKDKIRNFLFSLVKAI